MGELKLLELKRETLEMPEIQILVTDLKHELSKPKMLLLRAFFLGVNSVTGLDSKEETLLDKRLAQIGYRIDRPRDPVLHATGTIEPTYGQRIPRRY